MLHDPLTAYCPATQSEHAVAPDEEVKPALHGTHVDDEMAEMMVEYEPEPQLAQPEDPTMEL